MNNDANRTAAKRIRQNDAPELLQIDGLVAAPQALVPQALASLPRITCTEDFYCTDHGTTPNQVWRGPSLLEIIRLAQPQPEAKYVRVHAQNYTIPLALAELEGALLAESLNGEPLSVERGAPWRLYVPGAKCHISVKWVDRLELTATRGTSPEERVARARERGRIAAGNR
jgi:DMSO/TMAO reductase YedYZ molybdopterin-dependent catalytic subunit